MLVVDIKMKGNMHVSNNNQTVRENIGHLVLFLREKIIIVA